MKVGLAIVLALPLAACSAGGGGEAPNAKPAAPLSRATPEVYVAHRQQATALYAQADLRGALKEALQALSAAPGAREAYVLVSKIAIDSGRDAEALEFFERVARQLPDQFEPQYYRGYHAFRLSRWDDARAAFERAAELSPSDADTQFRLGLLHQARAEYDRAEARLGKAFELDPRVPVYAARYARVLRITGKYDAAATVVERGLAVDPRSAELLHARAQLLMRDGKDAEAEASLRKAIEIEPGLKDAHNDLGRILARTGRRDESARELAVAASLGRYLEERERLLDLVAAHPDDPAPALGLAELEIGASHGTEGRRWVARAERLGAPAARIAKAKAEVDKLGASAAMPRSVSD